MQLLKKYSAVLFFVIAFPLIGFFAKNFILEASTDIYAHIPQESDVVIEVNTRNFISEISYQRIYQETYFLNKMYPPKEEQEEDYEEVINEDESLNMGFDVFSKIVLFREQWATENIWIAVLKYTNKEDFQNFILSKSPDAHFAFGDTYAIVQLNASSNQEKLNEHLKKISNKEIKGFTERIDLNSIFDPNKEINCYMIPKVTSDKQLIEGQLSFDFLGDHIEIKGDFTPIPNFDPSEKIAYAADSDAALSIRSCLNVFNSIYWFNQERIENIPDYNQMAFDYNGVDCYLTKIDNLSSAPPFKSFPKMKLAFDISESQIWYDFFDSLHANGQIAVDTLRKEFYTKDNAFFRYDLTKDHFRLMQTPFELEPNVDEHVYFDLHMNIDPLLENTKILIDQENPPSMLEQSIIPAFAKERIEAFKDIASIASINFQLKEGENNMVAAEGKIIMKDKNGQSMVEGLSFGTALLLYLKGFGL